MNLAEQVKILVAGLAVRMFNGLITAKRDSLFFGGAGKPQRLAQKDKRKKSHEDNQRQKKCLLKYHIE